MKKAFTQKQKDLTKQIVKDFGYWSDEFKIHIETFHPYVWEKVHNYAKQVTRNEI